MEDLEVGFDPMMGAFIEECITMDKVTDYVDHIFGKLNSPDAKDFIEPEPDSELFLTEESIQDILENFKQEILENFQADVFEDVTEDRISEVEKVLSDIKENQAALDQDQLDKIKAELLKYKEAQYRKLLDKVSSLEKEQTNRLDQLEKKLAGLNLGSNSEVDQEYKRLVVKLEEKIEKLQERLIKKEENSLELEQRLTSKIDRIKDDLSVRFANQAETATQRFQSLEKNLKLQAADMQTQFKELEYKQVAADQGLQEKVTLVEKSIQDLLTTIEKFKELIKTENKEDEIRDLKIINNLDELSQELNNQFTNIYQNSELKSQAKQAILDKLSELVKQTKDPEQIKAATKLIDSLSSVAQVLAKDFDQLNSVLKQSKSIEELVKNLENVKQATDYEEIRSERLKNRLDNVQFLNKES